MPKACNFSDAVANMIHSIRTIQENNRFLAQGLKFLIGEMIDRIMVAEKRLKLITEIQVRICNKT